MATRKAKAQKELIKAATIATALDKVTGKILGWAVKSNSSSAYYHIQTMIIDGVREFFCDCEARTWGYCECAHIQALKEMLVAKAELEQANEAQAAVAEAEKIVTAQIAEQGSVEVFPQATPVEVKRSPAFSAPTFTNRGFYMAPVAELGGRFVPLKR